MTAAVRAAKRTPLLQVTKSAIATVLAWLIAGWLIQGPPPIFAAIAALLVVQPSLNQSFSKAIERSVGVMAGVVIASLLGLALGDAAWVTLLSVVIALLVAWALRMTPGSANQVAISALLVLTLGSATANYALDRILETLIGAVIGIIVNVLLVPPVTVRPANQHVLALGEELAVSLERLATAFERPRTRGQLEELMLEARLMKPMRDTAEKAITTGQESLTLNPRGRRHRDELAALSALMNRFDPIVTQVIGMTRAFYDHYDPSLSEEPAVQAIAEQLRRAAHDVRLDIVRTGAAHGIDLTESGTVPASDSPLAATITTEDSDPALTAPLRVTLPSPDHWVLIGSLMEDLRRIHETLSEPM